MKLIKNFGEFEALTEEIKKNIKWYEKARDFDNSTFVLYLANGENIGFKIARNNLAHLFGIDTDYLRSTGLFEKLSSYDMLMKICDNPYEIHKHVNEGHLTYRSFISDYHETKLKYFIDNCNVNFNDIEFVCKYDKNKSYITGFEQLEGDYYIAYRKENGLLILGIKRNGKFYYPMTSMYLEDGNIETEEFLKQLLTGQVITYSNSMRIDYYKRNNDTITTNSTPTIYTNFKRKHKYITTLCKYRDEYNSVVSVERDTLYILEKVGDAYSKYDEVDNLLGEISKYMSSKRIIDIKELEIKFGKLSYGVSLLVKSYNKSIEMGIEAAIDAYTTSIIEERDKIKAELLSLRQELENVRKNYKAQSIKIEELQIENKEYQQREEGIKKILERK